MAINFLALLAAAAATLFGNAAVAAATAASTPEHVPWPALAQLARSGAQVSAAAVDLDNRHVLDELHADTHLTPASLTKLVTAAAVLNQWPPDKVFHTRLLTSGAIVAGELRGDLVLLGAGDASLDDQSFWSLAAQLRGAGVTRVRGRLVLIAAPFGAVGCETQDRCDALQHSDRSYNAPLGALGVDFGNWCLLVRPGPPGTVAALQGCGVNQLPVAVEGTIRSVAASARQTFWVERVTDAKGDHLRVGGDIPAGPAQQLYRAMSDPVRGAGLLLKEMLRELGVSMTGEVVTAVAAPPATANTLADVQGLPLGEQLGRMLRYSNNYIADVLTLDLAAEMSGSAPAQLSSAATVLSDFLAGLETPAAPTMLLHSGSGLTPENLLSANDLVTVLAHAYRETRRFPTYYAGLVVPRDAPFGFLREGKDAWLDRIALKTGSMDVPHSVLGIAGYLRKRDGGWIAFAAIVNGGPDRAHIPLREALQAARSDVEDLLARY
ncbi:MAG TPA: D-alanyl-D-alanine carboxypeptidase/D-alanyl-D-alanine-endopeptidase [Steroidobacteraceae bacterium]|nr:D-alanyl-D-alanine carboxypeptidase/D-alanyl-D-alanine-endopeptidase [Steroidobacteraceae bacterium]